jgi:phosphopantetheinyl transferase (holo-ACP synthase)
MPAAGDPGLGIDLLEIGRLQRALERHPRPALRVFTEGELQYAADRIAGKPPQIRPSGRAAAAADGRNIGFSLTHSRDIAAAVAMIG